LELQAKVYPEIIHQTGQGREPFSYAR
jgi:hypothetical protein